MYSSGLTEAAPRGEKALQLSAPHREAGLPLALASLLTDVRGSGGPPLFGALSSNRSAAWEGFSQWRRAVSTQVRLIIQL